MEEQGMSFCILTPDHLSLKVTINSSMKRPSTKRPAKGQKQQKHADAKAGGRADWGNNAQGMKHGTHRGPRSMPKSQNFTLKKTKIGHGSRGHMLGMDPGYPV